MQTFHALVNQPVGTTAIVSPEIVVPAGITDIDCQLILAASTPNWTSQQVAGSVWEWAIEFLDSSGNFESLVSQTLANNNALAVGQLGKNGTLPRMAVSRAGLPGMTIRGWCCCSRTVNTSLDIITGP